MSVGSEEDGIKSELRFRPNKGGVLCPVGAEWVWACVWGARGPAWLCGVWWVGRSLRAQVGKAERPSKGYTFGVVCNSGCTSGPSPAPRIGTTPVWSCLWSAEGGEKRLTLLRADHLAHAESWKRSPSERVPTLPSWGAALTGLLEPAISLHNSKSPCPQIASCYRPSFCSEIVSRQIPNSSFPTGTSFPGPLLGLNT